MLCRSIAVLVCRQKKVKIFLAVQAEFKQKVSRSEDISEKAEQDRKVVELHRLCSVQPACFVF